jgi:hypothetical protein
MLNPTLAEHWRARILATALRGMVGLLLAGCSESVLGAEYPNLALSARASAFEFQPGLPPELANDGQQETRWSGIPGHNIGGWYELHWEQPVRIGQVIVFQYDRYVREMDVQVWDDDAVAQGRGVPVRAPRNHPAAPGQHHQRTQLQ